LFPIQDPLINLVLEQLDESNSGGLISQKELTAAFMKINNENDLKIDNQDLLEMVNAVYVNENGSKEKSLTRKGVREAMEKVDEVKKLSE